MGPKRTTPRVTPLCTVRPLLWLCRALARWPTLSQLSTAVRTSNRVSIPQNSFIQIDRSINQAGRTREAANSRTAAKQKRGKVLNFPCETGLQYSNTATATDGDQGARHFHPSRTRRRPIHVCTNQCTPAERSQLAEHKQVSSTQRGLAPVRGLLDNLLHTYR